jgi:hypothetical protein
MGYGGVIGGRDDPFFLLPSFISFTTGLIGYFSITLVPNKIGFLL